MTTTNEGDKKLMADIAAVEACSVCGGSGTDCRADGLGPLDCPACSGTGRRPAMGGPSEALRFGAEIVQASSDGRWNVQTRTHWLGSFTPGAWFKRDPEYDLIGSFESYAAALAALNAAPPPPGWVEPGVPDALKPGALGEQPPVPESTWTKETQRLAVEPQSANVGTVREVLATTHYVGNSLTNRPETAGERDARERQAIFDALDALGDLQRRIGEAVFEIALKVKHYGVGAAPYVSRRIEDDARRAVAALRKLEREP